MPSPRAVAPVAGEPTIGGACDALAALLLRSDALGRVGHLVLLVPQTACIAVRSPACQRGDHRLPVLRLHASSFMPHSLPSLLVRRLVRQGMYV